MYRLSCKTHALNFECLRTILKTSLKKKQSRKLVFKTLLSNSLLTLECHILLFVTDGTLIAIHIKLILFKLIIIIIIHFYGLEALKNIT